MEAPAPAMLTGLVAVALMAAVGSAPAQAPQTGLAVDITRSGWIDLVLRAREGSRALFSERAGGRLVPLGSATVGPFGVVLPRAARWRCDRLRRRFEAVAVAPGGAVSTAAFSVRTPSCRERLALSLPRRAPPGRRVRIKVLDRWRIGGVRAALCIAPVRRNPRCRGLTLRRDQTRRSASFTPHSQGRWRVELRLAGHAVRRTVQIGAGRAPARRRRARSVLLATGDSTMQGIDSFLAEKLVRVARVRSQIRVATGISKPIRPSWVELAARQARRVRPRVTVVSLGALDNFSMLTPSLQAVHCCGFPWMAEYERRAEIMMRAYARRGRGRVAWLALAAPRDERLVAMSAAINEATRRAAASVPGVLRVRLDAIFSPDGRYHPTLRRNGREVRVRSPDGIHLSAEGTAIAADAIVRALVRTKALPRP